MKNKILGGTMKTKIIVALSVMLAFTVGYSINNIAISNTAPAYKIATVDIQKIVANSAEVQTLQKEQTIQMQNMQKIVDKARAEISKEKDPQKASQLEDKYRNELNQQKLALDQSYNNKLTSIDNKIKTAVVEKAKSMHYNVVLPKNTVLFGGDDITEQVMSIIN